MPAHCWISGKGPALSLDRPTIDPSKWKKRLPTLWQVAWQGGKRRKRLNEPSIKHLILIKSVGFLDIEY